MANDLILVNALLAGRIVDIAIRGGRFASLEPAGRTRSAGARLDVGGRLCLPALINGHIHLDKTLLGHPWRPHQAGGGSVADRIAAEKRIRRELDGHTEDRAAKLLEASIRRGVT